MTGLNLDLLKMFLNLLNTRSDWGVTEAAEFQIDETYSVPVNEIKSLVFNVCIYNEPISVQS